jgi:hypothetical protein
MNICRRKGSTSRLGTLKGLEKDWKPANVLHHRPLACIPRRPLARCIPRRLSRLVQPKLGPLLPRNKHVVNVLDNTCRRTRSGCIAYSVFLTGRSVTLITR